MQLPRFTAEIAVARLDVVVARATAISEFLRTQCLVPCGPGTVCTPDVYNGGPFRYSARCCPTGAIACGGQCHAPCLNPLHIFRTTTCACDCKFPWNDDVGGMDMLGPHCNPGRTWDAILCRCGCPATPCPLPKVRNPITCACECQPPFTDCSGICRDLSISDTNCGACGNVCNQGEDCCGGVCTPLDTCTDCGFCGNACAPDEGCCNRARRKLNTTLNCGLYDEGCGVKCDAGEICQAGACVCPSGRIKCGSICCPLGQQCCNGTCTNTKTSKLHCGRCNNPVPQGWDCCNSLPTDIRSDRQHCGACNKPLTAAQISAGFECCNGVPTNTQTTAQHCGACNRPCQGGASCNSQTNVCTPYVPVCQGGNCVCPPGWYPCGTNWCAPSTHPVCCTNGSIRACPANSTCCASGTGCC